MPPSEKVVVVVIPLAGIVFWIGKGMRDWELCLMWERWKCLLWYKRQCFVAKKWEWKRWGSERERCLWEETWRETEICLVWWSGKIYPLMLGLYLRKITCSRVKFQRMGNEVGNKHNEPNAFRLKCFKMGLTKKIFINSIPYCKNYQFLNPHIWGKMKYYIANWHTT